MSHTVADPAVESASSPWASSPTAPPPPATSVRRVLHVVNGEHFSGAERVQDLLAGYLPACGYEVAFACVKADRFPEARQHRGAALYEVPMRWKFDGLAARRVAQLVRAEQYELIHAHTPRSLLIGGLAAKRTSTPLIYHVHSPAGRDSTRVLQNRFNVWTERTYARRSAQLIAVSPSVRNYMIDQGFDPNHVSCVANGVPRLATPPRYAAPTTWTLGMAALFRPRKGVEILLEALAAARSTGIDVRLRAIGPFESTSYRRDTLRLVDRLALEEAIDWTGFVHDVPAELAKIDALALPSLFGEGLPMVVLEAMAAGVPVIASHVEGVPEAIRHRQDGLLVEPSSVSQLAYAIEELASGSFNYSAMSANAQRRHAARFSAEVMARGVADVYDRILSV
ncbi:MAG: glycosyltransferase [Planctomycetota bacterium]